MRPGLSLVVATKWKCIYIFFIFTVSLHYCPANLTWTQTSSWLFFLRYLCTTKHSQTSPHMEMCTRMRKRTQAKKKKRLTVTDSTPQEMLSTVCGREFHSVWHEGREEIQRENSCTTEDTTLQTSPDPRFPATCENEPTGSSRIFCFAATRE